MIVYKIEKLDYEINLVFIIKIKINLNEDLNFVFVKIIHDFLINYY